MKHFILLAITLSLFILSCLKEDKSNSAGITLELRTDKKDNPTLSWDEPKISTLKEVILVRTITSSSPSSKLSAIASKDIIFRTSDPERLFFKDSLSIGKVYYRLYANLGDRIFASNEVEGNSSVKIVNNLSAVSLKTGIFDWEKKVYYAMNSSGSKIDRIDLKDYTSLSSTSGSVVVSNALTRMALGGPGFENELYVPMGNSISIFDKNTLQKIGSLPSSNAYYLSTDERGYIYYGNYAINKIVCVDRTAAATKFTFGRSISSDLIAYTYNNEIVKVRSSFWSDVFAFNPLSGVVTDSVVSFAGIPDALRFTFTPDGKKFIYYNSSNLQMTLSDNRFNVISITNEFNLSSVSNLRVTPDGKYLAITCFDSGLSTQGQFVILYEIGSSTLKRVKHFPIKISSIIDVFIDKEKIYLLGNFFDSINSRFGVAIHEIEYNN